MKIIMSVVEMLLVFSVTIMVLPLVVYGALIETESSHGPSVRNSVVLCDIPNEPDKGECVAHTDCVAYGKINNVTSQNSVERASFIKQIQCNGSETVQYVCCPRNSAVYREQSMVPLNQPATVAPVSCGLQTISTHILAGGLALIDEFPWMAMLWYQWYDNDPTPGCGGALISHTYVITAAHCVTGENFKLRNTRLKYVRLREHNINTDPDCVLEMDVKDCSDPVLDLEPKAIIPHPDYVEDSSNQEHDIALIRIVETPPFSDFLGSICLPERNFEDDAKSGMKLFASGWGRTDIFKDTIGPDVLSPIKLKVSLPYVTWDNCNEIFRPWTIRLGPGQMCAGGERIKDTCAGNSGSPLMSFDWKRGIWSITGIVSMGVRGCGVEGLPGVYTNVHHYLPWIKSITGL